MNELADINRRLTWRYFFHGQLQHLLLVLVLVPGGIALVEQGAFRYSSNAMYTFGLLILWTIALWAQSRTALAMAMFQHAYIWVHLYCTEAPDLKVLYGDDNDVNLKKE